MCLYEENYYKEEVIQIQEISKVSNKNSIKKESDNESYKESDNESDNESYKE